MQYVRTYYHAAGVEDYVSHFVKACRQARCCYTAMLKQCSGQQMLNCEPSRPPANAENKSKYTHVVLMSFVFVMRPTERAVLARYKYQRTGMSTRPMHRSQQPIRISYTELVLQLVLTIYGPSCTFLELIFPWMLVCYILYMVTYMSGTNQLNQAL